MSVTGTLSDGATLRLKRSGDSWTADPAGVIVAAATGGIDQEDLHESIPGGEDRTVRSHPSVVELTNHDESGTAVIYCNYDSDSSATDFSEGCHISEGEASGSTSVGRFQSLVWLNVNSNGKTTRSGKSSAKETAMEIDGDVQHRQTDTTQAAMEQVGLTLPKTGMMLSLMVSSEEKQKLLANTKVKMISDAAKKPVKKTQVKTTDTQTENSPDLNVLSRSWTDVRDVNVNRYNISSHSDSHSTDVQAPKSGIFVSDEPPEGSATLRMPTEQDNRHTYGYDMEDVMQIPLICDRQSALQHAASFEKDALQPSCLTKSSKAGKLLYGQGRGMEAQPLLPGPSWRFDNEDIDVCNHDNIHSVVCRKEDPGRRQQTCACASTAIDPQKQYLASPPSDVLKRHSDQYSERDHQDKRVRHNSQDYLNSSEGYSQHLNRLSWRDENEDMISRDETSAKNAKPVKTRMTTTQVGHRGRFPPGSDRMLKNTDKADGRTERQHSDSHLTSSANEEFTPFTTDSHNGSSPLDAVKIAQFTEYIENMRKNMRQDYRGLSLLIKSFTEELQERNNNQSSQSQSDVNQSPKTSDTNEKGRCLIM